MLETGIMEKPTSVISSFINSISIHSTSNEGLWDLDITMIKNRDDGATTTYRYFNVSTAAISEFIGSESLGSYYSTCIRGTYEWKKITAK